MRITLSILIAGVLLSGCPQVTESVADVVEAADAVKVAPVVPAPAAPTLTDESRLTESGSYMGPAWSPDGAWISFTGARHRGLYRVGADGGAVETLVGADAGPWFRHGWADGPLRVVRDARGSTPARELVVNTGALRDRTDVPASPVALRDDQLVLVDGDQPLTHGEDRFFDPVVSPDGRYVAVVGLSSGIHVLDLQTRLAAAHGGRGTHPVWSPDSAWVLFERTEDDGMQVTGADLWAVFVAGARLPQALTSTSDAQETNPSVSPSGDRVAFVRDGAVWTAALQLGAS